MSALIKQFFKESRKLKSRHLLVHARDFTRFHIEVPVQAWVRLFKQFYYRIVFIELKYTRRTVLFSITSIIFSDLYPKKALKNIL